MASLPLRPRLTRKIRRILYYPLDTLDLLTGRRPPDRMIFVGDGSWRAVGSEFLGHFRSLAFLQPHHHVLDIGSGIGRMAAPLTRYLSTEGTYAGFDIVREGVEWCRTNITSRHPNFTFVHSDVFNKHYNPAGKVRAAEYAFPFQDGNFDVVLLTSVFTHMLPADLANYLSQISRVLKPGGRCLMTFFVLNQEADENIRAGRSALPFFRHPEGYYTISSDDPEVAVGYEEGYLGNQIGRAGLAVEGPIHYGSWSGRSRYVSFQDIIVGRKSP